MALQMSPVDAHSENQLLCQRHQPAGFLQPELAAAGTSGCSECQQQLLEWSSSDEQVPLPSERDPVPPSLREVEQRVAPEVTACLDRGDEEKLHEDAIMASPVRRVDLREEGCGGGAASATLSPSKVSQSSVIVSSEGTWSTGTTATTGLAVRPHCDGPSRLTDEYEVGSVAASSSSSNSLNDAQKDSGGDDDAEADNASHSSTRCLATSFNQSTLTFSGETNPPSATYYVDEEGKNVKGRGVKSAAVSDGDYCDNKEPLIYERRSQREAAAAGAASPSYNPPTGPASNRFWGIPKGAGLRGGANETTLNNGTSTWGQPPATSGWGNATSAGSGASSAVGSSGSQVQNQWGVASSGANVQRSSAASHGPPGAPPPGSASQSVSTSQQLSTGAQQQPTQSAWDTSKTVAPSSTSPSSVWGAQAAKNVSNPPANPNQEIINAGPLNLAQGGNAGGNGGSMGGGNGGGSGPATPSSGKPDPLANYREVIYSQDGWGGNQVNQDTQWDVPTSPEPKEIPLWKQTASNGTEVWEVNLRNGGLAPPPIPQTKTPWGSHTPATNLGGTWGEDDDSAETSSMWTGAPNNNGPNNWGGPNPMSAPIGAGGPMGPTPGGPGVAAAAAAAMGTGMPSGNGMWGGPKKEPEWAGPSAMQTAPGGWGDVRPAQRMGMPVPDTMGMAPAAPSHWPGQQSKPGPQWTGNVPPMDQAKKPSGWDEHSPPAQKRPVHNYDDGTAVWAVQNQQAGASGVCRWKDMPNPNVAGGRGGMQQTGPPTNRMPPGPGMKPDMPWNQSQQRNGSWGDGMGGDQGNMNNMWMEDKPGGGSSWNEPPQTPTPWATGPKPKTPTTPSWGEAEDALSWGQPPKQQGPKPLAKEMIWASKQFRILSDMGFKKEDVENVLRNCNMVMEDALETLRSGRMGMYGDDHSVGSGGAYDPMGQHGSAPYPPRGFNQGGQMGMPFHPGAGGAAHLLNNPTTGMGMNPNPPYKILQAQQPPPMPPQINQGQMGRNMPRVDTGLATGGGAGSQPSPTQLRILVQQIQMAVQAGHLNPQILNQPLAPQTLVLLNQLLQQIKILQQLGQQHAMAISRPGQSGSMMQLVPQMNKTKQQIASLQQQIANQQALHVKQQGGGGGAPMISQQPPGAPPGQPSDFFKVDTVHGIQATLERMNMQDSGQQSRLSQWKYPPHDKDMDLNMPDAWPGSRAPGGGGGAPGGPLPSGSKPTLGSTMSSPNMNSVIGQDSSAWSTHGRSQSEGWPDSNPDLSAPVGGDVDKNSWGAGGTPSYTGSISDLVPEFEPGKPWKGPQIKTADDDPTLTPGTFAMSGLGNEGDVYSKGSGSAKASPPPTGAGGAPGSGPGGSTAGDSGFSSGLGLSNSTWSFNPSSTSTVAPSTSTPYSTAKVAPKSTWSDAPPPSADPWSAPNKPRGPPPGITTAAGSQGGPKGGRDWSSAGGSRSPWPGATPTGTGGTWSGSLSNASSWLVLRNLTPQIDGSTLKTLCVQHGPLHNFHLYLNHGVALVRYSTGEEAAKAQSALNNCVLGNTTIYADLANESDVQGWLQQLGMPAQQQTQQQQTSSSGSGWGVRGSTPGTGSSTGGGNGGNGGGTNASKASGSAGDNWSATGSSGPSASPWSTGSTSVWSTPSLDRDMRATPSSLNASLNSFLPGDLLSNDPI